MKKIVILLSIILLLSVTTVCAQDFKATLIPHTHSIKQNESAAYTLVISHPFSTPQTFELYSTDVLWDIRMKDVLIVSPGEEFETTLYIRPLNLNPGMYSIPLNLKLTGTNQILKKNIPLEVTSQFPPSTTYLPAVRGKVTMQRKMDPKDPVRIYVLLENQNKKLLKNVRVRLRSNVINKDYDAILKSQESKKITFEAIIDPYTPPQKDVMRVTVVAIEGEDVYQFDLEPVEYTIIKYSDIIEETYEEKSTLKTVRRILVKNEGNIRTEQRYTQPTTFISSLFSMTNPRAKRIGNDLVWNLDLEKGEALHIEVVVNHRPLVFLILAAIILIVAYFIFRSPLVMIKQAAVIGTKEGGISELKVLLTIKNRSKKKVKEVRIIDLIPQLAALKHDEEIGTIMPDKVVQNELKGTILKWHLDYIEAGEERLISYKIRSKLSILGGVTLPVVVAKFKIQKRTRHANSNKVSVGFLK
jgi:hypothetical protein